MGDLMSKLTMRRKGISGGAKAAPAEDPVERGGGGAMDKISGMIPPPPVLGAESDQEDNEDDWD
jgi:hypothetical protein